MLISVHLPKTGGTSFLRSLHEHYGSGLMLDNDNPMHMSYAERNRAAMAAKSRIARLDPSVIHCIHGHFLPVKYQHFATSNKVQFITWMRDPVERLLSHYYFWKQPFDESKVGVLRRKMAEEDWSVERFCLGQEMRSLYKQYLWDFPVENFLFIGVMEYYDEDFRYFSDKFLGKSQTSYNMNVGSRKSDYTDLDQAFRKAIEVHHEEDMALYRYALEKRNSSCSG